MYNRINYIRICFNAVDIVVLELLIYVITVNRYHRQPDHKPDMFLLDQPYKERNLKN